MENPVPVSVIL